MKVTQSRDAGGFCDKVLPFLLQHEAENNLMIGILLGLADGTGKWGDDPPVLFVVEEDGLEVAIAVQTPPHNLLLTRADNTAVDVLATEMNSRRIAFPGILGPVSAAGDFSKRWSAIAGCDIKLEKNMCIYQLDQVFPPTHVSGSARLADSEDTGLVLQWQRSFDEECGLQHGLSEEKVRKAIQDHHVLMWQDDCPVSMAFMSGSTPNGMRVSGVYTPPEHRSRGYASANVAAMSQQFLDAGCQFCYLFTDLANPTSNSIYQKIGYRRVCDFVSYRFLQETK